jgi:hypothetical protein
MPFQQRAIFIGGPYDGLTKVFPFGVNDLVVFEFDLRRGYRVRTKRYFKVHESANASTVTFELEEPPMAPPRRKSRRFSTICSSTSTGTTKRSRAA